MKIFDSLAVRARPQILVIVRVLFGLMWLEGASWKNPPLFGLKSGQDLYFWVHRAVDYPVLPAYTWFVQNIVLKNFLLFGWMVLFIELSLGIGFLLGIRTRILSLLALGHITNITLSVLNAPHEWHWSYFLMYMVAAVLFVSDTDTTKLSADYWINKFFENKRLVKKK